MRRKSVIAKTGRNFRREISMRKCDENSRRKTRIDEKITEKRMTREFVMRRHIMRNIFIKKIRKYICIGKRYAKREFPARISLRVNFSIHFFVQELYRVKDAR